MVIKWITKLTDTIWKGKKNPSCDIGVVSPYKKQCSLIRKELSNIDCGGISVGSAETYQGQERRIIIISTVRTGDQLGFVSHEQVKFIK